MKTMFKPFTGGTLHVLITENEEIFTDGYLAGGKRYEMTEVSAQQGMCTIPVPIDADGRTLDGVLAYDGELFHVQFNEARGVTEVVS